MGFADHPEIQQLVSARCRLFVQTQIAEDCIGTQKNTQFTTAQKKFKKPEASMAAVLRAQTISKKHQYTDIVCDLPVDAKTVKLDGADFRPSVVNASLDFSVIVSSKQNTDWWSPGPGNHMVPIADLQMLKQAMSTSGLEVVPDAWLGAFVDVQHRCILRVDGFHDEGLWMFGLGWFSDSACYGWPCKLVEVPGSAVRMVELSTAVKEPALFSIFDVAKVKACSVKWRSWLWQRQTLTHHDSLRFLLKPIPRLFVGDGPDDLMVIAAKSAFWKLDMSFLSKFGRHMHFDVGGSSTLCSMLSALIKSILTCNDEKVVEILSTRLAANDVSATCTKELMGLEEALDCMDINDVKKIHEEQSHHEAAASSRNVFVQEYAVLRRKVNDAKLAACKAKKAKPKAKATPAHLKLEGVIPQAEAKLFLPAGASI